MATDVAAVAEAATETATEPVAEPVATRARRSAGTSVKGEAADSEIDANSNTKVESLKTRGSQMRRKSSKENASSARRWGIASKTVLKKEKTPTQLISTLQKKKNTPETGAMTTAFTR